MLKLKYFLEKLHNNSKLKLRPGEFVEVKSEREIFATLDEHSAYEKLAFTEEMRRYCGKRFRVLKRVNKLVVEGIDGLRCIKDTVILDGVFCTGKYYGGCGKFCPLLWKEAWLKRVSSENKKPSEPSNGQVDYFCVKATGCQALSLVKATAPIKAWNFWHYFWEINSEETWGLIPFVRLIDMLKFKVDFLVRPSKFNLRGEKRITPVEVLNLKTGENVEVKSRAEILKTLDFKGRNRGLEFMPEMLKYCGKQFKVLRRVEKMTIDATGETRLIPNTVILEGVYCDGKAHRGCQRMCFCLWREIWLKRVRVDAN